MTPPVLLLAAAALVPAMTGPIPAGERTGTKSGLIAALCGGGNVAITFDHGRGPSPATRPCCAKGCHAGARRKRFDPKQ